MIVPFLRRAWRRLRYRHFDDDLREELAHHRAATERTLCAGGWDIHEARLHASRRLGNELLERERARAVWIPILVEQFIQDARCARRSLARTPGFVTSAVVMLAVGIGVVTGFYVVFNGLFVRGWNLPESDRLFVARASRANAPVAGRIDDGFSVGTYRHILGGGHAADYVALAYDYVRIRTTAGTGGDHTPALYVSPNFVAAMKLPLRVGAAPSGEAAGVPSVVISDLIWRRTFAADPNVVGRTLWVNGTATAIAGVVASDFDSLGPRPIDLIAVMTDAPRLSSRSIAPLMTNESACCLQVAGRLRDGWTLEQTEQELGVLTAQYRQAAQLPRLVVTIDDTTAGRELMNRPNGQAVVFTLSLVGLACTMIWMLACSNVGNLYLARSLRRRFEIRLRLALGASRGRVIRQLLTEGAVLGLLSGAGALLLTFGVPLVFNLIDDGTPTSMFPTDWRATLVAGCAAALASLFVSLAPALQTTKFPWRAATASTPGTNRLRALLLAAQIAIATVLVFGAALLTRAITSAMSLETDYALRTTTVVELHPPAPESTGTMSRSNDARAATSATQALRRAVSTLQTSGDLALALANSTPGRGLNGFSTVVQEDRSEVEFRADLIPLSTAALRILDIPLVRGRDAADEPDRREAVINESLARLMWPSDNPLGRQIAIRFNRLNYTVVGIVRDAHLTRLDRQDSMVHIAPSSDLPSPMFLARDTPDLERRVRAMLKEAVPGVTVQVTPLSQTLRGTISDAAIGAAIAWSLGAVALLVAMLGVFTVFAYVVEERRRDVSIRLALGASRRQIRRTMFRATSGALTLGLVAGVALTVLAGHLLRSFLFGLSPLDPTTYIAVALLLLGSALLATAIPVRRSLRIDPAVSLRSD